MYLIVLWYLNTLTRGRVSFSVYFNIYCWNTKKRSFWRKTLLHPKMNRSDFDAWPILERIDDDLFKKLKTIYVYGSMANCAIMVTDEDDVYSVGENKTGCLGTGDTFIKIKPHKIDILCQKKIKDFVWGSDDHVLALTQDGKVYSWGTNRYGQLGLAFSRYAHDDNPVPSLLPMSTAVVQIACGRDRSLALTLDGEVYFWGKVLVPNSSKTHPLVCSRKTIGSPVRGVKQIACDHSQNFALRESGEIYSFSANANVAVKIKTAEDLIVTKIACGYSHMLILTDTGNLYGCGSSDVYQLGINLSGAGTGTEPPIKINQQEMGKVLDIGALNTSHMSTALTHEGRVFMWGLCRGIVVQEPTLTRFKSIHEALGAYGAPGIMHTPLHLEAKVARTSMIDCLKQAFDDSTSSDLVIQVEGKPIHVHKALLNIRSNYFCVMFQGKWKESNETVIINDHFSYEVYKCFLRFLYTDEIILPSENSFDELLNLANSYVQTDLKRKCATAIRPHINVQNVFSLYKASIMYDVQDLKDFCFKFALNHMTAIIKSPNFLETDDCALKTFLIEAAASNAFKM